MQTEGFILMCCFLMIRYFMQKGGLEGIHLGIYSVFLWCSFTLGVFVNATFSAVKNIFHFEHCLLSDLKLCN